FLTTHNLSEAESLCHQIGVLRRGKLVAQGAPDQLRRKAAHTNLEIKLHAELPSELSDQLAELGLLNDPKQQNNTLVGQLPAQSTAAPVVRYLVEQGVEVEEVHKENASLEEVFLTLVSEAEHDA
ncbi:MAG: DUF4162 domain-containing protein, partial [Anaerolineales bacterium]